MKPSQVFTPEEQRSVVGAIREVEAASSVEIRVHVENRCPGPVLDRAAAVFERLGMRSTAERNGVLVYVALKDRVSAILGDENVDKHTGPGFWERTLEGMNGRFSRGEFTGGIVGAIRSVGEALRGRFPAGAVNPNELADEISFEED